MVESTFYDTDGMFPAGAVSARLILLELGILAHSRGNCDHALPTGSLQMARTFYITIIFCIIFNNVRCIVPKESARCNWDEWRNFFAT